MWDISAAAQLQLFHAHAVRNGARLRWAHYPEASAEIIEEFERIANQSNQ